jgi:cell division transport system permease protein
MAVLIAMSVFVVSNTVKITYHSRELEISIMRYIGATKYYITMPFIVEGIILSLVSASVAYVTQWYIYRFVVERIVSDYDFISIIPYASLNNLFLLIFFGASLVIGIFGTAITIRKYMRV